MKNNDGNDNMHETNIILNKAYSYGNSEAENINNLNKNIEKDNINNNIYNEKEKITKTQRKLYVDLEHGTIVNQPEKFCDNSIRTSQYTLYSFLPLAIINQYKTPFNWFFLIQAIIDCIPAISSVNRTTTIMPIVIVLMISLIREAVEDYRKYSNDKLANETMVSIYKCLAF